jgi:molybdopterin-biosynthesis enzyme MoeA-like protein
MATPEADDLTADAIAVAAQQPQSGSVDGVQAAAHSIPDQIAADRYRRTQAALPASGGSAWGCLRTARVQPPGAAG